MKNAKLDKIKAAEAIVVYKVCSDLLPQDCSEKIFITTKLDGVPKALKTYFENVKYFLHMRGGHTTKVEDKLYGKNGKIDTDSFFCRVDYFENGKIKKTENRWVEKVNLTGAHVAAYMNIVNMDKVEFC